MRLTIDKPKRRVSNFWTIYDQLKRGVIKLDAPYQRDIVWSKNKMSMLIDSAMNNYYIPPLIFSVRPTPDGNVRYCIDGKQRLSSIWKFMRNEIPYIDETGDKSEDFYFDPTGTQDVLEGASNRKYITDRERERFNDIEFTMIEYNNLSEDEELEIFSRVQMGVSLTAGEKLYAFNSPSAIFCKELTKKYDLKYIITKSNRGESLKCISHLVYLLYENHVNDDVIVNTYMGQSVNLQRFLKNHNIVLSDTFKEKVTIIFNVYEKISDDSQGVQVLNFGNSNRKHKLSMMLFIIFGIYIYTYRRTLKQYISDLQHLRNHFDTNYKQNLAVGNPAYQEGLNWIKTIREKIESEQNEDDDHIDHKSESVTFSTLPTTSTTTATASTSSSSLSPFITNSTSSNQANHHHHNDNNNKNTINKNKTNSTINNKNNNNNTKNKSKSKNVNHNILIGSSDDDSEDEDEIEEDSEEEEDIYGDKMDHKATTTTTTNKTSLTTDATTSTAPSKRLKLAHNNKTALNQQLKIDENKPPLGRPYMGQTSRSGQPMARRGGHRK